MIIWDPAKCAINDEIRITDYLGPVERLIHCNGSHALPPQG
jgi:hypothetical protein